MHALSLPALIGRGAIVSAASFLAGGLTSLGQTFLPDALRPFANSASGWMLLTALIVWGAALRTVASAVFGALSFVALVLGYTAVSNLRDFYFSPVFWSAVGVVAGPVVGVAAGWLRSTPTRAAIGAGVLAGIGLGEAAFGLTEVVETTGWFYWTLVGVLGVLLLGVIAWRRLRTPRLIGLELGVALATAIAFLFAFNLLGAILAG